MKNTFFTILIIFLISSSSCSLFENSNQFMGTTEKFVSALLEEDYEETIGYFGDEDLSRDSTVLVQLQNIRGKILKDFGRDLDYKLISATKRIDLDKSLSTPEGTTDIQVQISNDDYFGIITANFDDETGAIISFFIKDIKKLKPSMILFWVFFVFPLWVFVFNISLILRISRSQLKRKWLTYIAVLFLNIPGIGYAATTGLFFKLLHFQFLGIGISTSGYLNTEWMLGIPLGGIYWYYKLKDNKESLVSITETQTKEEQGGEQS